MEPTSTPDRALWARGVAASRLQAHSFTAAELIALAQRQGYPFLTAGLFRVWVHRGLFPPATSTQPGKSKPRGVWGREDALRLLDLCALHEQQALARSLHLGLWLLGYEPPKDQSDVVRDLLMAQIERIESVLFGRVMDTPPSSYSEPDMDLIAERIQAVVAGTRVLDAVSAEVDPSLFVADDDPLYDEAQDQHPNVAAGARLAELRRFHWLRQPGDPTHYPPTPAHAGAAYRIGLARRAERRSPTGAVIETPDVEVEVTSDQLAQLQREVLGYRLWLLAGLLAGLEGGLAVEFTLPGLRQAIASASDEQLTVARGAVMGQVMDTTYWYGRIPEPRRSGIDRLLKLARGDGRHVFASPALFPLTAYLIGVLVAGMLAVEHDVEPPAMMVPDAFPLALDQLGRLANESTSRIDAFLAVIATAVPRPRGEPRIQS